MNKQDAITQILKLVEESRTIMLGTNGENGFPNIKTMTNSKHEGYNKFWFSTRTSSMRVSQLKNDNRACIYFIDERNHNGLMLVGTVEILQDIESRKMLWSEGLKVYFPLGIEDPNYSVLYFTAKQGKYFNGLSNITFEIE